MVVALFVTLGCCCIGLLYGEMEATNRVSINEKRKESTYAPTYELNVIYNPVDPQEAVLEPGLNGSSWFLPIFGGVFLVVGVGVFFLLLRMGRFMAEPT